MSYVDNYMVRGKYVENFSLEYLEMSKCQSRFRYYTIPLVGLKILYIPHFSPPLRNIVLTIPLPDIVSKDYGKKSPLLIVI